MSENITGGTLSVETESMTFSAFGVKVRYAGALSNPGIKRRCFFFSRVLCMRDFNNASVIAGMCSSEMMYSIYFKKGVLIVEFVILNVAFSN